MNFADDDEQSSADESSNDDASIDDDDDRDSFMKLLPVYAPVADVSLAQPKVSKPATKRRSTISDWLPMQSFIDLKSDAKDDDSQWGWRSFMEIAAAN